MSEETPETEAFPFMKNSLIIEKNDLIPKLNDVKGVAYLRQKLAEAIAYRKQKVWRSYKSAIEREQMVQQAIDKMNLLK